MSYQVLLYYKFVTIEDPEAFKKEQLTLCSKLNLTGRILVGTEGLNGTVGGLKKDITKYKKALWKDSRFTDMVFKESESDILPFPKIKIKVREEIITIKDQTLIQQKSDYVTPDELEKLYESGEEFYVFDTRNTYETIEGAFKDSVTPELENFRDLPEMLDDFSELKDKKIVTVCTGGIRCEKASALFKKKGFKEVYQLEGGIVSYIHKYPNRNFEGDCYVFDDRMRLTQDEIAEGELSTSPKATVSQYR